MHCAVLVAGTILEAKILNLKELTYCLGVRMVVLGVNN